MAKKGLGRGLEHLLTENKKLNEMDQDELNLVEMLQVNDIAPNPFQPRKKFNEEALNELADSISKQGVFQPILVRKAIIGYELISGERRLRASKIANLSEIPAIIYDYDDQSMMEIALIENIQREDLSIVEEAKSLKMMMENLNFTQQEMADKIGKSRAYVANLVRIFKLSDDVIDLLDNDKITLGHVKVLISLEDNNLIREIVNKIISQKLSVRETEKIAIEHKSPKPSKSGKKPEQKSSSSANKRLEMILREKLDAYVKITGENKGTIEISYSSTEDLERLLEVLNIV